ncbi:tyrosine-protein phosphatase [Pseudomonas sp. ZM23]|uniref:Tyrosine-protein phosphatase n=1 Tax=Pseudomonas triclosanedens TaxID=2961893 RepID=A0ABY6ZUQ2_9PSED|nr:tyrosine-protein phosphatase [Pseudomonas triclosanedens]MCP8463278.1 tyrosine-protein phosphatase [Pseudomonas triclosanedens]MCP8469663.1 tyrosine-protein phosphatase [Pseudomonas triclosanedens]MCP8474080.1 tyrosine-protein phosphatase [Pseudomonas triclosanedens]WAI48526.1 tyrosine-protein phosphatase [Pseudomonas triclosanedens]
MSFPRILRAAVLMISLGAPLAFAAGEAPSDWAKPVDKSFNLYQMSPTLYRSALPNSQNLPLLEQLKVKTVVSFIKDDDKTWVGDQPINVVSFPTHADRVDDADVLKVLRILQQAELQGPVLMHCKHGRDRTGLFAAMYRTVVEGWSKEDALKEMTQGGFGTEDDMTDAIAYVQKADVNKLREALASGNCSTTVFSSCHLKEWLVSTFNEERPPHLGH